MAFKDRYLWLAMTTAAILMGSTGCTVPVDGATDVVEEQPQRAYMPPDTPKSDIRRIIATYSPVPWLIFDTQSGGKVDGFKTTVFLISPVTDPKTGKVHERGVFGTGTIVVELYQIERYRDGRKATLPVQTWQLSPDDAYPWRSKEAKYPFGWGYGLRLQWDAEHRLGGHEIGLMIKYVRDDGIVVGTRMKELHVPLRGI